MADKSNTLKLVFIILLVLGLILSLISLFTSAWRVYENANGMSFGLVSYDCHEAGDQVDRSDRILATDGACAQWWNARRDYERATMAFMILAVIAEIGALISAFILYKMMPRFYFIAPILAAIASLLLLLSFGLYAIKSDNHLPVLPTSAGNLVVPFHYGYSFWLAVLAFLTTLAAAILGFMASKRREVDRYHTTTGYNPAGVTVTTTTHERNTRQY